MSFQKIFPAIASNHLMPHRSVEMVLLKGHLILEVAIDNGVHLIVSEADYERYEGLSFHRKLLTLQELRPRVRADLDRALKHLLEINRIRNRFAHEFFFHGGLNAIDAWSAAVLEDFPIFPEKRRSTRTRLIEAIGNLGSVMVDPASDYAVEVAGTG